MAGLLGFGRDTLQAASNAIAGNVAGPVDLINAGLLRIGLPMPAEPFGGSAWMERQGLTRRVDDPYARAAGETLGLVGPMVAAAKAPQIAQGLLNHGEAYRRYHGATTAPGAPATVWHGSPHKFDKFDSSKIGTGEGAQAYGHGLYFAENQKVAKGYRDQLKRLVMTADGRSLTPGSPEYMAATDIVNMGYDRALKSASDDVTMRLFPTRAKDIEALKGVKVDMTPQGHLYKVDLSDDAIAKMLNWDAPLSKQPEAVRGAFEKVMRDAGVQSYKTDGMRVYLGVGAEDGLRGQDVYRRVVQDSRDGAIMAGRNAATTLPAAQAEASQYLRSLGLPGIRYLDGGSRGAGTGTSNYVVFPGNENLLTILGRE